MRTSSTPSAILSRALQLCLLAWLLLLPTEHLYGAAEPAYVSITCVGLDVEGQFYYKQGEKYIAFNVPCYAQSETISHPAGVPFQLWRQEKEGDKVIYTLAGTVEIKTEKSVLVLIESTDTKRLKFEKLENDWKVFPAGNYRLYNKTSTPIGVAVGEVHSLLHPGESQMKSPPEGLNEAVFRVYVETSNNLNRIINNYIFFSPNKRSTLFIVESESAYFRINTGSGAGLVSSGKYHLVIVEETASKVEDMARRVAGRQSN